MSDIVLLDTSVYLNVLNVPGFNQDRDAVLNHFQEAIESQCTFLLPLACVWEAGKHIAQLSDGRRRRDFAEILVKDVKDAFAGNVPYSPTHFPKRDEFEQWLDEFPESATHRKSLADHSLIQEWQRNCDLNPTRRVRIWSLDNHLASYDRRP